MKKIKTGFGHCHDLVPKFDLKMKLTLTLFVMVLFQMKAEISYGQKAKVTLNMLNASIIEVIDTIESTTEFKFFYSREELDVDRKVNIQVKRESIETVLNKVFTSSKIGYKVKDDHIVLFQKKQDLPNPEKAGDPQQQVWVSGTATDQAGNPLPGVNVLEKGTTNGVLTDFDGNYTIDVSGPETVLVFSFIGMQTIELAVGEQESINIKMAEDIEGLDEVIVVGYGTQRRDKIVGGVDQVSSKAFEGRPSTNVTQALQGKSPALNIQQNNFEPGAGINLNIRGISTLGNNSPLIVIDGIVAGDINSLNPSDIESVSVLKDAGSAAIYGSRASNGVVLITTKKGNKNRPMTVEYNGLSGINTPHFFTRPVKGYENAILRNEAAFNAGETSAVFTSAEIRAFQEQGDFEWFAKEITKDALQQNHNLSVSGGNENTTYLVSAGFTDQESNFVGPAKGLRRYNYRINLTTDYKKLKLTATMAYAKQIIRDHSASTAGLMVDAFRVPLYFQQKDSLGRYLTNDVLQEFNSLGILEKGGFRRYDNDDLFGNVSAELALSETLKLRGVFGGRLYNNFQFARTLQLDYFPKGISGANRNTNDEMRKSLDLNTQLLLEYNRIFSEKHDLNVLLGASNENHQDRGIGIFKRFTDPDLGTPTSETEIDEGSYNSNQSSSKNSLNSLFGRASYTFDDRYTAEFSFRYDGSSKFRKELRWGFFPSLGLNYKLTRESFMENYREKVGNVSLRSSYGVLGNQNVGNFQYQTTYFTFQNAYGYNNVGVSGAGYNFANPDLEWEKAATFNVGADLDFFKRALTISGDYYNKITKDILVPPAVPGVYGTSLPDFNAGEVQNQGWELTATYRHYGDLFNHSLSVNVGDSKNKVLKFEGNERLTRLEELQVLLREGLPYNSYVGLKRDGYFQNVEEIANSAVPEGLTVVPGDNKYVDLNGDGVINDDDKFIFGNPFPRFTFGITYDVTFKNFDFSMFWQGVGKRTMMIRGELVEPFHFNYGATAYTHQLDYWIPENTDARYPRLANNGSQSNTNNFRRGSDMYLYDGKYVRLKNLQVGFTLPKTATDNMGLTKMRIYASGQNLVTLSKVKFVDPELSEFDSNFGSEGANSGRSYPTPIYYGLGLDVIF